MKKRSRRQRLQIVFFRIKQDMQVARIVHRIIRYFISDVINNSKEKIEGSTKTSIDDLNKETFIDFSENIVSTIR